MKYTIIGRIMLSVLGTGKTIWYFYGGWRLEVIELALLLVVVIIVVLQSLGIIFLTC